MAKTKFYAVAEGTIPGIYRDWDACKAQVFGVKNARFKSFDTMAMAADYMSQHRRGMSTTISPLGVVKGGIEKNRGGAEKRNSIRATAVVAQAQHRPKIQRQISATPEVLADPGTIEIFTDGSSRGNGTTGATAGFGVYFGPEDPRNIAGRLPGPRQTNQRAELMAIIRALESVGQNPKVIIKTDSQYSINCLTVWHQGWVRNGWKNSHNKEVENKDLIQRGLQLLTSRQGPTQLVKVSAHVGIHGNEMADRLANEGALKPR